MPLTGDHFLGGQRSAAAPRTLAARNPATGETLPVEFAEATAAEVDQAFHLADAAFDALQTTPVEQIAALLDAIARGIADSGDELIARAHAETALPLPRLQGERTRTASQTRMFAELVRGGSWLQARIDHAIPDRQPLPKPDIRTLLFGVGPIAVFGASNFPLAISVAGTDTVAAFAARCPVVVKAHPGHPGTCELTAQIVAAAIAEVGLPAGMFSLLHGASHEVGLAMVRHPLTAAVAFTGSLRGGRALFDAAAARSEPIPVYAEMGSVNPVFLLPGAAAERAEAIAAGFVQSVTLGVGQFCTNPGVVLAPPGEGRERFLAAASAAAAAAPPATMLHEGIRQAYARGVERLAGQSGVALAASSQQAPDAGRCEADCRIFVAGPELLDGNAWQEEVFGPASVVVRCRDLAQLYDAARQMTGSLTATIHGTEAELVEHAELVRILSRKAGRLVFNGFPTGLEPCASLHHGGPYPAATFSQHTSVGTAAIYRFVRPLSFQGFPQAALPPELQDANPRGVARVIDGRLQ